MGKMTFMDELQEEKHHVGDTASTWKKVLCSDEINNFLALCKMLCRSTLHIKLSTPSSIVLGGGPFISRGQRRWSELVGRGIELNSGQSRMEVPSCSKHRGRVTKCFSLKHFHMTERDRQSPDLQLLRICSKAWKLLQGFQQVRLTRS